MQRHKRFGKFYKMFPFEKNCSDNERDNNNGTSQGNVNYPTAITKLSIHVGELESAACVRVSKRRQFSLRQSKSESNVRRCSKIDKMGSRISRSRSFDNVESDSIVYESLVKDKSVNKDEKSLCSFDDFDDDYKLLESSEDEGDSNSEAGGDDANCIMSAAGNISKTVFDGHDTTENRLLESNINNINCIEQPRRVITSTGNEIQSDLLCKKYSTLPRVKIKKGNVDHDHIVRCSVPNKSFDNRAHCSKETMSESQVQSDGNSATIKIAGIPEVPDNSDRRNDLETFKSTTLPKTRSRLSEPFFRHSLRQAIESTMPRKHFRISNASEHSAIIIPDSTLESASGTGKKRLMRILNMFN